MTDTTTETRDLIARVRADIAPADQPQALRDLARTADGEPRVDAGMLLDVADDPAAWVFYAPREEIHAMIREMGGDPEKLAEEGRQLAEGLLAKNLVGDFTQIEPLSNEEAAAEEAALRRCGQDLVDQIDAALAAIGFPEPHCDFLCEAALSGVIAAHPETVAELDAAEPKWRELLHASRVVESRYLAPGQLYTGRAFLDGAAAALDATATNMDKARETADEIGRLLDEGSEG